MEGLDTNMSTGEQRIFFIAMTCTTDGLAGIKVFIFIIPSTDTHLFVNPEFLHKIPFFVSIHQPDLILIGRPRSFRVFLLSNQISFEPIGQL